MPPPSLFAGYLTFGSFCSPYNLTDEVIAAWATILRGAPGSRLFLKDHTLERIYREVAVSSA